MTYRLILYFMACLGCLFLGGAIIMLLEMLLEMTR